MPFNYRGLEFKTGGQEIPDVTGKFSLGIQSEAGQKLTEFCEENAQIIANTFFQQQQEMTTHGYHQVVNTKIRLIIVFAVKDGEVLYSQQKQDCGVNILLQNSG